ncbi:hypothetical protein [Helicobacter burdigaliensis]|uniref:hypothetical protein n=1 Tax=Helicobacter burdigaliensis TaxID=2315334 RepID=UPI000EF65D15|nr:hypothetical protein [Helicobacter burdigaliensis]
MKKITFPQLIFSSLFFVFALFTILMLFLAGFAGDFKQMFRLVTQPNGVYFSIEIVLIASGVIVSAFHLVRIFVSHLPKIYSFVIGLALVLFVAFLYHELFVFQRTYFDGFSLEDSLKLMQEDVFYKSNYQRVLDYGCYLLLVVFPSVIYLFNLSFDKNTQLGRILHLTQPSFNIIIGTLFAFGITPFFKSGVLGYFDFILFVLGILILCFFAFKRRNFLNSYEFFNFFLLVILAIIMLGATYMNVDGEAYFEIRKAFYALVLFGWCNAWMMKLTTKI